MNESESVHRFSTRRDCGCRDAAWSYAGRGRRAGREAGWRRKGRERGKKEANVPSDEGSGGFSQEGSGGEGLEVFREERVDLLHLNNLHGGHWHRREQPVRRR